MSEITQIANALYEVLEGTAEHPTRVSGPIMLNGEPTDYRDGEFRVMMGPIGPITILETPSDEFLAAQAANQQAAADAEQARADQVALHHVAYNAATTVDQLRVAFADGIGDGFSVEEVVRG